MITLSRIVPQYLPTQTRQVSCLQVYELNEFDIIYESLTFCRYRF